MSKDSIQITINDFLEVDLAYSRTQIWESIVQKLKGPQGLEDSKNERGSPGVLELNGVLERGVLRELSQLVFASVKSQQSLEVLCQDFYTHFKLMISERALFLLVFRNCERRLREILTVARAEYAPIPFLLTKELLDEGEVSKAFHFPCREVFYALFKSMPVLSLTSDELDFLHRRTKLDILECVF